MLSKLKGVGPACPPMPYNVLRFLRAIVDPIGWVVANSSFGYPPASPEGEADGGQVAGGDGLPWSSAMFRCCRSGLPARQCLTAFGASSEPPLSIWVGSSEYVVWLGRRERPALKTFLVDRLPLYALGFAAGRRLRLRRPGLLDAARCAREEAGFMKPFTILKV